MNPVYRYHLQLKVNSDPSRHLCVVGLNPANDDSRLVSGTVYSVEGFARDWNCGKVDMVNLFGARSTKPEGLKEFDDPTGPDNEAAVQKYIGSAAIVLAAWGSLTQFGEAWKITHCYPLLTRLLVMLRNHDEAYCLGITKNGQPIHARCTYYKGRARFRYPTN